MLSAEPNFNPDKNVMKQNLLTLCALAALLLPAGLCAQDENKKPAAPVDRQQLREQLRDMSPEERVAKMRELREQGVLPGGGAAQRQGQGGQQPGMMGGAGGIARILMVLTPEQRESMRATAEADREKTRELEEKIRDARKAALEATLEKKFNEEALRQKLEAAAKIETELTVLRAKALSKVEPPLSEEQIEKIKNPPPMGDMMRQRQGSGPNGAPGAFRDQTRPRPPSDGPRDGNDLPMPAKP